MSLLGCLDKCLPIWRNCFHLVWGFVSFPCGSAGKQSACNARDLPLIPDLERSPGTGKGYLLECSGLENSVDCIVHGVAKNRTRLSYFHFHLGFVLCLQSFSSFLFEMLLDITFCVRESGLQTGELHILNLIERNLPCFAIDMSCYDANMYLTLAEETVTLTEALDKSQSSRKSVMKF